MISCNLKGGLGNQMFQIAATHALALRHGDNSCFDLYSCFTPLQGKPSINYIDTLFKNINHNQTLRFKNIHKEISFNFTPIEYSKDLLLDGYFQSEKYFLDYQSEIIDLFTITDFDKEAINELLSLNKYDSIISIHVRRGDYLKHSDIHPVCDLTYYNEAMKMFDNSTFIFISDDMKWVKENFKGDNIIYSPFNDEIMDLTLMTMCDNNIIANSTFSWWGAYLNKNKNKKIIAPKNWFGPKANKNETDIIPSSWIKL
jgi:hypothetical protein